MGVRIRYRFRIFLTVCLFTLCGKAQADESIWTALAARPDVKITAAEGLRTAKFSGGVVIQEMKEGGTLSVDKSGLGAVKCGWMLYSETSKLLKMCFTDSHEHYKNAYETAVSRIEDFIVKNNLTPTTKAELETAAQNMFSEGHKGAPLSQICASEFLPQGDTDLDEKGLKSFEASIDNLLSVPRPPVLNPCL